MRTCRTLVAGAALLAAAACTDLPTPAVPESPDPLVGKIVAMGYRADMIQDFGTYYLVEGDITFEKAKLAAMDPAAGPARPSDRPSRQYTSTNLVSSANVYTINVDLGPLIANADAEWVAAARAALTHWSGISGSYIRMVEATPADITVGTECRNDNVLGRANDFPSGGQPSTNVWVNLCWVVGGQYRVPTSLGKVELMVHELGHNIGFRHSNYTQLGESAGTVGANHVSGTPTSGNDAASVMNGGQAGVEWDGFSSNDRLAARTRYPLPPPQVGVTYSGGVTPVVSWNAIAGATSYHVYFEIERFYVGPGTFELVRSPVAFTSGTSVTDLDRTYTGMSMCEFRTVQGGVEEIYSYRVEANFANGTSSQIGAAETGNC